MKRALWCWNLLYWNILRWNRDMASAAEYVNPMRLVSKIPSVKRFYARRGLTRKDLRENALAVQERLGFNRFYAGWAILLIGGFFQFGVFILFYNLLRISPWSGFVQSKAFDYLSGPFVYAPVILWHYFASWRHDRCEKYFKEFEKLPADRRRRYGWISFAAIIGVGLFVVCSDLLGRLLQSIGTN